MFEFLLKSTMTMTALLGLYYLLFEREKMHRFNRFYLIFALVFSLVVPFVSLPIYNEVFTRHLSVISLPPLELNRKNQGESVNNYLPFILWSIYGSITLLLAIRFIHNIRAFIKRAASNEIIEHETAKLVLLDEKILPHTFLKYIFLNKEDYENRAIEEELYTHELAHVNQKHTLDILFIETLKVFFWYNPLFYFYKKAIQLNHEFLADQKVIATTANTIYYQNLLLEKVNVGTTFSMASNLNFSLTKKRFIMMTKTTSTVKAAFLKLAVTPVVAALMMLLCTKTIAQDLDVAIQDRLESLRATDAQVDSMKRADPDAFSDDPAIRYKNTTFRFIDKKGRVTEKIGYKKLTKKERKKIDMSSIFGAGILEFTETPKATDPEFPGGLEAFYKAINANFNIPKVDNNTTAKIYVSFSIEEDGTMSDIKVVKDPGYGLGKEAVRVIKLIKEKWKPGTRDGIPVKTSYTLPITITIKK